jgi:bacterioferritin-associated ferredoxin
MKIDRCVCFNVPFETIKQNGDLSLPVINDLYGCGSKCGMCIPYIKRMMKTGETSFEQIILSNDDDTVH